MHSEAENKDYRVGRLNKTNLGDLDELHKAVYGSARPADFFQKKYDTAYTGAEYLGYIAYNRQDTAIAYYGVMPCFVQYANKVILSAQSGDTMTHPQYRNRGLFVELCNRTIELCREEGVRFLFGFPNQNSYPGFVNRLGWLTTEEMECFCLPVSAIPWGSLSNRFPFLKGIYRFYTAAILKKYTLPRRGIAGSVMNTSFGGVYRDDAWFNYKTYNTTQVIRVGRAMAWISIAHALIIGDLELEGQDFDHTIRGLKKIAASLGLRQLFFHSSPGTPLHHLFATRYKRIPSFPVIFKDLEAGIPLDKIKFTFADIDTF